MIEWKMGDVVALHNDSRVLRRVTARIETGFAGAVSAEQWQCASAPLDVTCDLLSSAFLTIRFGRHRRSLRRRRTVLGFDRRPRCHASCCPASQGWFRSLTAASMIPAINCQPGTTVNKDAGHDN